ncbi:hypothetical protein [Kitasatospora sp. SUK 42]|uniref:hypothetical protein n=1 Tax=Kitasatospora sp. SUK 42 TaxID=1588882 RepID=UPI00273A1745|nr:hypothetical protein [Kitasatospora sp. SUK 42]
MAAIPRPRRRTAALPVAVLTGLAALLVLAALVLGRSTPGGLSDHGPAQAVTPPPKSVPLWPGLATPTPAPPAASVTQEPPKPIPGLTVPGRDLTTVDVRALLGKDPAVGPEERRSLDSCTECEVRSPEFRDLTGDGRQSLITAVTTPGPIVLHVYTLAEDRVLPILQVSVQHNFSAETVGSDLKLYELTSANVRTSSYYHWDGVRLSLQERRQEGVSLIPPTGSTAEPTAGPSPVAPGTAPGAAVPSPYPGHPTFRPTARPTAAPTAVPTPAPTAPSAPSAPAVLPEAKR